MFKYKTSKKLNSQYTFGLILSNNVGFGFYRQTQNE